MSFVVGGSGGNDRSGGGNGSGKVGKTGRAGNAGASMGGGHTMDRVAVQMLEEVKLVLVKSRVQPMTQCIVPSDQERWRDIVAGGGNGGGSGGGGRGGGRGGSRSGGSGGGGGGIEKVLDVVDTGNCQPGNWLH